MTRTPPTELINDSPTVCVQINKQWVSHVMGRLQALTQDWFWSGDETTVYDATQEAEKLMNSLALGSEACMVPIGAIMAWPRSSSPVNAPPNYLFCDGGSALIADYPELFAVIGTTFGSPTPGVSFGLPNLSGRVLVGQGTGFAFGSTGGATTVTLTTAQIPAHSHSILTRSGAPTGTNTRLAQAGGSSSDNASQSTENAGSGNAHENMPPFLALNYIIRAK